MTGGTSNRAVCTSLCENASSMPASWLSLAALAIAIAGVVYLWFRDRTLQTKMNGLASELERRNSEF